MIDVFFAARFAPMAALLAASLAYGASPSSADLARCASIAAPAARLTCYDALANQGQNQAHVAASVAGTAVAGTGLATSAAAATPPTAAAPAPAAAPLVVEDPKNFGLSATQQHIAYSGIQSEKARIVSIGGSEPGQAIVTLDNGQAWKVTDDDGGLSKDNQVTIKRAALGSFLMVLPSHHVYRVRRIS